MKVLTQAQADSFWQNGYLLVNNVVTPELLKAMQADFSNWVEQSKQYTDAYGESLDGRPRFDVQPGHNAEQPALRRINAPTEVSDNFYKASMDSVMTDCVADLLGPNIKFHHDKVNSKLPHSKTQVKWHQDFPFTPHTNDNLVTALLMLDDVNETNGPLQILPGSHKGAINSLWHDGQFTGAIDNAIAADCERDSILCTGQAGSVCLMHTRLLHGSSVNNSDRPRTLHISVYSAEDAIACSPSPVPNRYQGLVVRGQTTGRMRGQTLDIEMPQLPEQASFFAQQEGHK